MTRPVHHWDLAVQLERAPEEGTKGAIFVRLARAIAEDIQRGRLVPGARLPGSRALAKTLAVHRNTVLAAYRELRAEGYLAARPGQSTFVAPALPERAPRRLIQPAPSGRRSPVRPLRFASPAPAALPFDQPPKGVLGLYGGRPDLCLLPVDALARAYRRVLRRPDVLGYGDPRGHLRLREALAAMLRANRGLALDAGELVVMRGSQMGLALCAKALFSAGDVVAVERWGYRPAWEALRAAGARLVPVPVDRDGLRIDALEALCGRERVRGVYLTPHHQYPTTAALSAPRRFALLALAEREGFAILEDDYDHEFHYEGRPHLPLASLDRARRVVYIGTLSKVLAPGVRIGYVTAQDELLQRLVAQRFYLDRQGDHVTECAVAELLEEGEIQRHVRRARRVYLARRDAFTALLEAHLSEELSYRIPPGGMALWARVTASVDPAAWLEQARKQNVIFQLGQQFDFGNRNAPYVRLGFAGLSEAQLAEAVRRLVRARQRLRPPRR